MKRCVGTLYVSLCLIVLLTSSCVTDPVGDNHTQVPVTDGAETLLRVVNEPVIPLLYGDQDGVPDMLILNAEYSEGTTYYLSYKASGHTTPRWDRVLARQTEEEPLDFNFSDVTLTYDESQIVMMNGNRLQVLRLDDGALIWELALSSNIDTLCTSCLKRIGQQILVLTENELLQSFDADGNVMWQYQLAFDGASRRGIFEVGQEIAVVDVPPDEPGSDAIFYVLDLKSGVVQRELVPTCVDPEGFFGDTQLGIYDPIILGNDGETVAFAFIGIRWLCVQRWDITQGEPLWQQIIPGNLRLPSSDPEQVVFFGGDALYVGGEVDGLDALLLKFALDDGAVSELFRAQDYEMIKPLLEMDNRLLIQVEREHYGPVAFWMLESEVGSLFWQYDPGLMTSPSDDSWWGARSTERGLLIVAGSEDPPLVSLSWLDIESGALVDGTSTELPVDSAPFMETAWSGRWVYITLRGTVYGLDLESGLLEYVWGRPVTDLSGD